MGRDSAADSGRSSDEIEEVMKMIDEKKLIRELERRCTHNEVCVTSEKFTLKELVYIIETFPKVKSKFPPEIGQILKNQIVIMGRTSGTRDFERGFLSFSDEDKAIEAWNRRSEK